MTAIAKICYLFTSYHKYNVYIVVLAYKIAVFFCLLFIVE